MSSYYPPSLSTPTFNPELYSTQTSSTTTFSSLTVAGNLTQSSGIANLSALTVAGNLSQLSGSADFQTVTVAGLSCGNGTVSAKTITGNTSMNTITFSTTNATIATGNIQTVNATTLNVAGNVTQSAGTTASLKALTVPSISCTGTASVTGNLTASANITQSAGTASLKAVTADSMYHNSLATYVYPIKYGTYLVDAALGNTDIVFSSIPSWARHVQILFHQLTTYVGLNGAFFYVQPGSTGGYWDDPDCYCGQMNVFSVSTGQDGSTLTSYIPLLQSNVNTLLTNTHLSGQITLQKMGTVLNRDYWNITGQWYFHANYWLYFVGGTLWSKYDNQALDRIRINNNSSVLDNRKWSGHAQIVYWG